MSAANVLARLEALLEEEREALTRLEAPRVVVLTEEKEAIVLALSEGMSNASCDEREHFARLLEDMRRNVVLYAHARDCLRDAVLVLKAHTTAPKRIDVTG
jgi:hypothetical protein